MSTPVSLIRLGRAANIEVISLVFFRWLGLIGANGAMAFGVIYWWGDNGNLAGMKSNLTSWSLIS